jgi:pimeloyl-ACP methyl ester carboxylesterase
MPSIQLNGNEIYYISSNVADTSKPTLFLLHGAGQSHLTWEHQIEFLTHLQGNSFVIPDLPGHGKSTGNGLKSVSEYTEFIKKFINELGLEVIVLIGHSMGGAVAQVLALDRPTYLKAIVLVCTGAWMTVARETLLAVKNNYEAFCDISPTRSFSDLSPEILRTKFKEGLENTDQKVAYDDLIACNNFDIADRVSDIKIPTLIIAGQEDILTPLKYSEYLNHQIYGSELKVIEGSGHFVMQEKPDEFNKVVLDFIKDSG